MAKGSFKYLGVEVTRNLSSLFTKNFTVLLEKCKLDFDRWKDLPLSVAERVNILKMIVLPTFFYLFQNIPILISLSSVHFTSLWAPFIWKGGSHRIKKKMLFRDKKNKAGLAPLNFIYYYWACNIQNNLHWVHFNKDQCDSWVSIEYATSHQHLGSLGCAALAPPAIQSNLIVSQTIKIWTQFRRHFGLKNTSIYAPIWGNHNFPPASLDASYQVCHAKGIKFLFNLFSDGQFCSELRPLIFQSQVSSNTYKSKALPKKPFSSFPNIPNSNILNNILSVSPAKQRLISTLYKSINDAYPTSLEEIKKR